MSRDTQLHHCPFPANLTGLGRYLLLIKSKRGDTHKGLWGGSIAQKNCPNFWQLISTPARSRVYFPAVMN
jgi:hypothetical protein